MKKMMWILAAALMLLAGAAHADRYDAELNINKYGKVGASNGHVSFVLQSDGTVKGTLVSLSGQPFQFGFDSREHLLTRDYVLSTGDIKDIGALASNPDDIYSIGTLLGNFESGFTCYYCAKEISWTIVGKNGLALTSVKQVLGGDADADFALISYFGPGTKNVLYAGNGIYNPVPEPSTWGMVLLGLLLMASCRSRNSTQTRTFADPASL